jgi:hypothetical protein
MRGVLARPMCRNVTYLCSSCGHEAVQALVPGATPSPCPGCGRVVRVEEEGLSPNLQVLTRCASCGLDRLYVQKDFNKKAGLWVFIVAAALSVPTWGLSLVAATLIDLVLYYWLGDATVCYGCGAVHRGFAKNPRHGPFDIHVQESVDRGARLA